MISDVHLPLKGVCMTAYPKLDHEIDVVTSNNMRIHGMINVLGRSISTYLQGTEPDVIMYHCTIDGDRSVDTLMIAKHQIVTVQTGEQEQPEKRIGHWQRLKLMLNDGNTIMGDVNMTGYDRLSDFIQNNDDHFYELHSVQTDDGFSELLYVSRIATLWKEPAD